MAKVQAVLPSARHRARYESVVFVALRPLIVLEPISPGRLVLPTGMWLSLKEPLVTITRDNTSCAISPEASSGKTYVLRSHYISKRTSGEARPNGEGLNYARPLIKMSD